MPYQRTKVKEKYRQKSVKLMDQVLEVLRYHHYAIRTEDAYVKWILKFIRFHGTRHPKEMGKSETEAFLSHLAINRHVAASTQNQEMNAILFLYREVLHLPINDKIEAVRSKKPKRLPAVVSREEVGRLFAQMSGRNQLMAKMLYGSGMRLMEVVRSWARSQVSHVPRSPRGRLLHRAAYPPLNSPPLSGAGRQVHTRHRFRGDKVQQSQSPRME